MQSKLGIEEVHDVTRMLPESSISKFAKLKLEINIRVSRVFGLTIKRHNLLSYNFP